MTTGRRERSQAVHVFLCLLLSIGTLLGAATVLQAQERTGAITGELKDESGGVLPGATVVMTNLQTGRVTTLQTDGQGMFRAELEPGDYSVRYELSGFARQELPDVAVLLGRTFTLNVTMKVGNVSEAVQVTAEASPQIDLRSTTIAHNVTADEIDRMPKARTFQGIAMTAPSVNEGDVEGGFQVNGASSAENSFTVDGVVTNSLVNGASRQNTVFEYLQEVQVKTTGIPAEYGGALGGVISAVTKSGGNLFHGEGHYYFQGSEIGAGPVNRLVLSTVDDKTVSYVQDSKQPDHQNEFGGSLGGPIVRNKLWFFGAVSPRYNRRTNTYKFRNGIETGDMKRSQDLLQAFGKVSYGSRRVNAYGTALYTPNTTVGTLSSYNGASPNVISSSLAGNASNRDRGYKITQTSTTGNIDVIVSSAAFLTARGGYFYDNYTDTGIPTTTSYTYQTPTSASLVPVPASLQGPSGTQNTPRARIINFDKTKRSFLNVDYNHTFKGGGWHTIKGGAGFQHTVNDVDLSYPGGYVLIFWGSTLTNPNGSTGTGTYGYYEVNKQGTIGTAGANIVSFYAQDEYQVSDRLTLNLGVRTEKEVIPSFRPEIKASAFEFGFGDKIAPRIGAAYDVRGDGKLKVFGSWGRYFDWTKYDLSRGSFGGDTAQVYYRAIDDPNTVTNLSLANMPGRDLWQVPGSFRDSAVPNFDTVAPGIKPMFQDSFSSGVDYQLSPRSVLTVHYVHNNLGRTIEDLGALVDGNEVYYYANPGEGIATITAPSGASAPFNTPKPKRQYDAVQIGLDRRFAGNWFLSANYTWSRLFGNYAGLASSDEIYTQTTGVGWGLAQQQSASVSRGGNNANRAWDLDQVLWDSKGTLDPRGLLATDRPHVVKLFGSYTLPMGTTLGAVFYGGSGTPLTTYLNTANQIPVFVNGRGDMGRTPVLTRTDLLVSHDFKMMGSRTFRTELNVLNVFNQKTARHIFNSINRGAGVTRLSSQPSLARVDLAKGYDYNALIRATPDGANAYDPRYGMADLFSTGAQAYVMAKFIF